MNRRRLLGFLATGVLIGACSQALAAPPVVPEALIAPTDAEAGVEKAWWRRRWGWRRRGWGWRRRRWRRW